MSHYHLTKTERSQIYALKSNHHSIRAIAKHLGVAPSTISREIKRNSGLKGYRYLQADKLAYERRAKASSRTKKMSGRLREQVVWMLGSQQWSPEQISGRLKLQGVHISHECIYQYIWQDRRSGGTLYRHLRHQGKKYAYKRGKTAGRGCIINRVDIDDRPKIVDDKSRLGDWEGDTIIGAKQSGVILSLVERASKFTLLTSLENKKADSTVAGVSSCFRRTSKLVAKTITFDNGKEFASHEKISKKFGVACYFAKPYSSWQRGLNEHTNGLVRQYLPKKTDLAIISKSTLQYIEDKLNNRPRKILGFKTPAEVYSRMSESQAVAIHC